jgi:predicted HicB family RNase H-like nuclease
MASGRRTLSDTINLINVDSYHAKIKYDEGTDLFRGEILGIAGAADFYESSPDELRREFKK